MLFDLVDTLQKKRRLLFVAIFIILDFWLLIFCNQALQSHRSDITERIDSSKSTAALPVYQSDMLDIGGLSASIGHTANSIELGFLRTTVAATDGITKAERSLQAASKATAHAVETGATATWRTTGRVTAATGRAIAFPFVAVGHGVGHVFGTTNSHLTSVIQPKKDIALPVITPEQAHQAYLIQDGTLAVKPVTPIGAGGACDGGAGNGGYPMPWCDAPMDSIQTVAYSADRINRECTSYAFWYFTTVGGHTDFHVTGNANHWAYTSNYPTHTIPAVGAIAVETAGAYGHVAIVQALPGQTHDGKVVPEGYALVSEMNYDWHGHFRYSYSPLNKFSAFIYP